MTVGHTLKATGIAAAVRARMIAAHARAMPAFVIIGAQKCGTTALYRYTCGQEQVVPALRKEIHYFDHNFARGEGWYRAHFPLNTSLRMRAVRLGGTVLTGEASPMYLFHPAVPRRVRRSMPHVRLLAILRNPVDRAYSHYWHERRNGRETLEFADAIRMEEERTGYALARLSDESMSYSWPVHRYTYKARGRYAEQIERWLQHFDRDALLVLRAEELYDDPEAAIRRVLCHLSLAGTPRLRPEHRRGGGAYPPMPPGIRSGLQEYFEPHNRRLRALLGDDFRW